MIKSISFQEGFIPLIKEDKKTVTRRIKTNLRADDICYFKVGRFGKKEGYLKIQNIIKVRLRDIRGDARELEKEGMLGSHYEVIMFDFIDLWNLLNKKEGCRWEDDPTVYRIKFVYLGKEYHGR